MVEVQPNQLACQVSPQNDHEEETPGPSLDLNDVLISDAGRTEPAPGTLTAIGIGPALIKPLTRLLDLCHYSYSDDVPPEMWSLRISDGIQKSVKRAFYRRFVGDAFTLPV
jgi:hypothetical protein